MFWFGIIRSPTVLSGDKILAVQETKKKGWKRQILKIAAAETIYCIWTARNEMVFYQQCTVPRTKDDIIESIVMRCTLHRKLNIHVNVTNFCIV